jgi:hypothetical protein
MQPTRSGGTRPNKIDHFRPKPGQLSQYADAALKFTEVYGAEPKILNDLYFLSNAVGDILDVRRKVWGQSGLKAVSQTNFATYPPDMFRERLDAWDDTLLTFPDDKKEPGAYELTGPDDPNIERAGMKVYATLRFALPQVLGIGTVVEITTTSRRSTDNLYNSLVYAHGVLGGNLIGVPFRLSVRPARSRYWDKAKRKRAVTEFFELVLDTPLTMSEIYEVVMQRRDSLQGRAEPQVALPPVRHDDADRDEEHGAFFADAEERQVDAALGEVVIPDTEPPDDGETVVGGEVVEPPAEDGQGDEYWQDKLEGLTEPTAAEPVTRGRRRP